MEPEYDVHITNVQCWSIKDRYQGLEVVASLTNHGSICIRIAIKACR